MASKQEFLNLQYPKSAKGSLLSLGRFSKFKRLRFEDQTEPFLISFQRVTTGKILSLLKTRLTKGRPQCHFVKLAAETGDIPAAKIFFHSKDVEEIHAYLEKKGDKSFDGGAGRHALCV
jgi:hypothetical protein